MNYVQIRYYLYSWFVLPMLKLPLLPKSIRFRLAMRGIEITLETFAWKIKEGHKK